VNVVVLVPATEPVVVVVVRSVFVIRGDPVVVAVVELTVVGKLAVMLAEVVVDAVDTTVLGRVVEVTGRIAAE
jgi:uncharacterized OB-fold protein